jgi:hypothetical protein
MFSEIAKLVMSVSSRFALNMAANVGLQYAAELLPTPVRAQGVGMIHIFGILAHSMAPYIVDTVRLYLLCKILHCILRLSSLCYLNSY